MATQNRATSEASPRRRPNWSIRTIVENLSGHPIAHFQDPSQSLPGSSDAPPARAASPRLIDASDFRAAEESETPDPIDSVYPPLVGALGREYHGADHEHHAETIARHRPGPDDGSTARRAPGPLARPERIYLHYLLLHIDRLSDTALVYLGHAVEEERIHRAKAKSPAPPT